jgi:hypothetical protein
MVRTDTADKLSSDIDRGRTVSKARAPDPAAAPPGADEEAAGTPLSREIIAQIQQIETEWPAPSPHGQGIGHAWVLIAAAFVIAVVLLSAILGRG